MKLSHPLPHLLRDQAGTVLIETAIVTPLLLLLGLGAFQISTAVARQAELQNAAADAASIALVAKPDTVAKQKGLQQVIMATAGLTADKVSVTQTYRCATQTTYVSDAATCGTSSMATYVLITLTDTYTPIWSSYGVGSALNFKVSRYVQIAQAG